MKDCFNFFISLLREIEFREFIKDGDFSLRIEEMGIDFFSDKDMGFVLIDDKLSGNLP
jgi:hypothetical protein